MLVVIREEKKLFFVICDNSQSQRNFFSVKNYSPKTDEVYKAARSSPAVLKATNFFKSCLTTYKGLDTERPLLSGKESIGIDTWHKIGKKFTMLRFSKPHDLFYFRVNYSEA